MTTYPILSQRDPKWSRKTVGYSIESIGNVGCLFMDLLMMVCHDQAWKDEYLDAHMACLKDHGNYTPASGAYLNSFDVAICEPVEWGSVKLGEVSPTFNLVDFPQSRMATLINHLRSGNPAIIEVDPTPGTLGIGDGVTHFVLAVGATSAGIPIINDPWYGDQVPLCPRYGPYPAYAIYRSVLYDIGGTPAHPTPTFTANVASMPPGNTCVLVWSADKASGIYLTDPPNAEHGVTGPTGNAIFRPVITTTYTLRVTYDNEPTVTLPVTVTINQPPVPTTPATHYLGVNVIHECDEAKTLSAEGCKAFLILDHTDVCEQIKAAHPDAIVINRRWSKDPMNGQQWWDKFGASCNTGVINEIFNEQDGSHDYKPASALRLRIDQEFQYADIARSRGALVAFGAFSQGTPEFNDPAIVDQLKRYAARYNSDPGIYLTVHNYSKDMAHIDNDADLEWYETRWGKFFTMCGLNPALRKIIASETGVDEGGIGGFPAHHATAAQFVHWCERYQQIITRPIVVNGVSYPSPVIASMIYCYTVGKEWQGHDISGWHNELKQVAKWG